MKQQLRNDYRLLRIRQVLWRVRLLVGPPNTLRGHLWELGSALWRLARQEGPRTAARRVYDEFRRRLQGSVPAVLIADYKYSHWIADHEPKPAELAQLSQAAQTLTFKPRFSLLLLDTPSTAARCLEDTLRSIAAQIYPHWEVCLLTTTTRAAELSHWEDRLRINNLDGHWPPPWQFNQALQMAQGDFVLWLKPGDCLAPHALFAIAKQLNENTSADLLYFDEDLVDNGKRSAPWFKPDWSPDLLLSINYLRCAAYRRNLLQSIGGADETLSDDFEWDVSLRCSERAARIVHIPRVLYHVHKAQPEPDLEPFHRRWENGHSHPDGLMDRDLAVLTRRQADQARSLAAHIERRLGKRPQVAFPQSGVPRIVWPISGTKVSIIIPTKEKPDLLRACVSSLLTFTRYPDYEIILVDNESTGPETLRYYTELASDARIRIVHYQERFNYSTANNLGARYARGNILLLLNNDIQVVDGDWLSEMVGWAEQPEVGIVGAKLLRPDGTIQHAGLIMGLAGHGSHVFDGGPEIQGGPFGSSEWYRDYMSVTGACLMMRRDVFEQLGGLDEAYRIGYGDIDLCLRAVALGYRIVYTPFARLIHHEGGTRGFHIPPADVLRASLKMWAQVKAGDRFFNPNLSYAHRIPALAAPGEEHREDRLVRIMKDFGLIGREALQPAQALVDDALRASEAPQEPNEKWRILLLCHDLSLSGAPLVLHLLGRCLLQQNYPVEVVSPYDGPLHKTYGEHGINVTIVPDVFEDARVAARILGHCDVVIANTIWPWRVVHAACAFEKPCIWWIHESKFGQNLFRQNGSMAQALAAASAVLFPAQATASLYTEFTPSEHFVISHYGIGPVIVANQREAFPRRNKKFYVVHVGSIESRKGQDVFLQAVLALPPDVASASEFFLIGRVLGWDFYRKIEAMSRGLKNVHIVGEVPHEAAVNYIRSADVFVLTSRDEVLPVTLLEAMCLGKPVISTQVGGVAEVIRHQANGLLVKNEDYQGVADNLVRLFRDREFMRRVGEAAQATGRDHLSMERFSADVVKLIDRVVLSFRGSYNLVNRSAEAVRSHPQI